MVASYQQEPITLDGKPLEASWQKSLPVIIHDPIANIDISLRAQHDGERLYLLASFADPQPNRAHKTLYWQKQERRYLPGPEREDVFVVKWNMDPLPTNLSIRGGDPHVADIWYWKAHRTDHAGFADDKRHIYAARPMPKAKPVLSLSGRTYYLQRPADRGRAAYQTTAFATKREDRELMYELQPPLGSRADVQAKGYWHNGQWQVEFARKLNTGHSDDLQMQQGGRYSFGISRYEVAAKKINPELQQPLYGAGDIASMHSLFIMPSP
uniref:Cytochrome c-552/DMSO reductase-like haem-binding domain-containing protein n=1 Tax=Magnetococcus massalia (strain MO-1) TaxID=451514 RepID=A0A1S7LM04_MAGMO|nr:protein of unknown function [Include Cytochrome c-552/DMSO reductase-like, haem-binding domain] [Candidatus Magnetococcus massalia]